MVFDKSKAGEMDALGIVLVIAALILVVQSGALSSFLPAQSSGGSAGASGGSAATSGNTVTVVGAPCTQGTTLSNNLRRRYTEASLTSENSTVFGNGARLAILSGNAGTTTVQSGVNGQDIDIYYAEDVSATYYTQHAKGKITECTSAASTGEDKYFKLVKDSSPADPADRIAYSEAPHKLVAIADGVTIDITNDGQANAQSGTNEVTGENLSVGTGGTGSVTLKFKVDYNEGWGVIGGNIMACQFPSSVYDSANPILFTVGGKKLEDASVSVPSSRFVLYQSNNTVKTWKFPSIDGRLTPAVDGSAVIRASSNNDPLSILDRFNCTVFDTDYYQTQSDGKFVLDIVNRDTNADLGGANTIFDFVVGVE